MHYCYSLHIVILFLEMCSCYREPSEAEVFAVFLVLTTSLQLPVAITSLNVIHLHVSVLGSRNNFMHVSDSYTYGLVSGNMVKA